MNQSVRNIYSKKKIDNDEKIIESKKFNVKLGSTKTRKKRHELSLSATRSINKHNVKIVVKFE